MVRREQPWLLAAILIAGFGLASVVTRQWAPWGDEFHYLDTVRLFGTGLSLNLLRTYPEMTAPLSFVTYSTWGHLVGFDTWRLRLLSPLLALGTCLLLANVLRSQGRSNVAVVIGTLAIAANPYFLGLSAFVFTDMLALLFMMIALTGVTRDRPWITGIGIAGAVLTRQYLAFLVPAVVLAVAFSRGARSTWRNQHVVSACVALVPFAGLVWLWDGGLNPINELRHNYVTGRGIQFNPHALSLYLAVPGIYLAPLLVWTTKRGVRRSSVAAGLALALVTLVFPIQPSDPQINEGSITVGFAHRALTYLLPPMAVSLVWYVAAAGWLAVMAEHLRANYAAWMRERATLSALVPWSAMLSFLVVMPFSYLPWEKYALPLLIGVVLSLPLGRAMTLSNTSGPRSATME